MGWGTDDQGGGKGQVMGSRQGAFLGGKAKDDDKGAGKSTDCKDRDTNDRTVGDHNTDNTDLSEQAAPQVSKRNRRWNRFKDRLETNTPDSIVEGGHKPE